MSGWDISDLIFLPATITVSPDPIDIQYLWCMLTNAYEICLSAVPEEK